MVNAELYKAIEQYIEHNYRPDNTPRKCLAVDKKGLFRSLFKHSTSHLEIMRGLNYLIAKLEDNETFSERYCGGLRKRSESRLRYMAKWEYPSSFLLRYAVIRNINQ